MKAGFRKAHMRAFCYNICELRTNARICALRNQPEIDNNRWNRFIDSSPPFV